MRRALNPELDVSQYSHTAWKIRDGFTKGIIKAIAQTVDGYLWLGTDFGLLRFDGVRNVAWDPPGGQHLPSAIGSFAKPITDEERQGIMRKEVPDTLKLYLEGKIEQFWFREDKPGVIFLMNAESVDQAKATIEALPLAANGFLEFDFIPVEPLKPLGLLIQP